MRPAFLALLLFLAKILPSHAQTSAGPGPVPGVSLNQVQSLVHQVESGTSTASTSTGVATWTFTTPFTVTPNCIASVQSTNASYSYSVRMTSVSTTAVSFTVTAALNVVTIALGSLTLFGNPPTGTVVGAICFVN